MSVFNGFKFFILFWAVMPFYSLAGDTHCNIPSSEVQKYLMMDYQSFDQSLPDGGWRGIANRGCNSAAAQLIDVYHIHHRDDLASWQARILFWHAGQLYALDELNDLGLNRFKKSLNPEERPNDDFKWNAYVNGSIAFLSKNLIDLIKYRDELSTASDQNSKVNLAILNRMIKCFGKTYSEVYNPSTACNP